jgi:hypothetical protein
MPTAQCRFVSSMTLIGISFEAGNLVLVPLSFVGDGWQ